MTLAELAQIAGRRSSTWWLLSRLVTEQPIGVWLDELQAVLAAVDADAVAPLGAESDLLLNALLRVRDQPDGLIALAVDRTRLLAGIMQKEGLPAPYESAALGLEMNSDLVLDVIECYRESGLEDFSLELGPPDFLGAELRFMALLGYREMQAYQERDAGLAALWLSRQVKFLDEHLLTWVPAHCKQLRDVAATPFYVALFNLLSQACVLDRGDLDQVSHCLAHELPADAAAVGSAA
jgi:putative dimethyl sulfoxide reductase chaperone